MTLRDILILFCNDRLCTLDKVYTFPLKISCVYEVETNKFYAFILILLELSKNHQIKFKHFL